MVKISTEIGIEITRVKDIELEKKIPKLKPALRLFCKIKFPEIESPEDALVDTGTTS